MYPRLEYMQSLELLKLYPAFANYRHLNFLEQIQEHAKSKLTNELFYICEEKRERRIT